MLQLCVGILIITARFSSAQRLGRHDTCRCFPGDTCWPRDEEWTAFNTSLSGKLVGTLPLPSTCHKTYGNYNATSCSALRAQWSNPETHFITSSSIMAPFFTNNSCNPFISEDAPCTLGNYVSYAVNVSSAGDIIRTLEFSTHHNIRTTIRNTGHDYLGKTTGAGALAIWTHHMKSIEVQHYASQHYTGSAIRVGAGVQVFEAYAAAQGHGLVVVGGLCPTVGLAGGYTQGGGHGPLAVQHGLSADQALEWEVVLADGRLVTATPNEHSELFWALSGGGGGTYGIVVSLTVKAYEDAPTSAANLAFSAVGTTNDKFWQAVGRFQSGVVAMASIGVYSSWLLANGTFAMAPAFGPGVSKERLHALLQPTIDTLLNLGIEYNLSMDDFPTFYDSYKTFGNPYPVGESQIGGRLIPRSLVIQSNDALVEVQRQLVDEGVVLSGVLVGAGLPTSSAVHNAVNPYWRQSLFSMTLGTTYDYSNYSNNAVLANKMTNDYIPMLAALTPQGAAYINEADFQQPDWQDVLYGSRYDRLVAIKTGYDPSSVFYTLHGVGSEGWYENESRGGRLCKVADRE